MGRPYINDTTAFAEVEFGDGSGNTFGMVIIVSYSTDDLDNPISFNYSNSRITIAFENVSAGHRYSLSSVIVFVGNRNFTCSYGNPNIYIDFPYEFVGVNLYGFWYNDYLGGGIPATNKTFVYGETSQSLSKLDEILDALGAINEAGEGHQFDQPSSEIQSGIDEIEQSESQIVSSANENATSEISTGETSILSFFNASLDSVNAVKKIFSDAVGQDGISILLWGSLILAVLPVLLGLFQRFR